MWQGKIRNPWNIWISRYIRTFRLIFVTSLYFEHLINLLSYHKCWLKDFYYVRVDVFLNPYFMNTYFCYVIFVSFYPVSCIISETRVRELRSRLLIIVIPETHIPTKGLYLIKMASSLKASWLRYKQTVLFHYFVISYANESSAFEN